MPFSRLIVLVGTVVCGAWFVPQRGHAQEPLLSQAPLTFATKDAPSPAEPPAAWPGDFAFARPTDRPAVRDELQDFPIYGCACGCGVFEVGTNSMFPHGQRGMLWQEWDYQDQNRNRHGTSSAPSKNNEDKDIRTDFFTTGLEYFFNRKWAIELEVPFAHRYFETADASYDWTALGDIRLKGLYTGFSEDQSIGLDAGLKLPTGNFTHSGPDRDTEIGAGSTDILLGGFYRTNLGANPNWNFFTQLEADLPVFIQDRYRPGIEVDGAIGVYYSGFTFHGVTISPVGQAILSYRSSDGGENSSHPVASGYERVLLSPGIEFDMRSFSIYADVEFPVFQDFRGDQLAAQVLFKLVLSFSF